MNDADDPRGWGDTDYPQRWVTAEGAGDPQVTAEDPVDDADDPHERVTAEDPEDPVDDADGSSAMGDCRQPCVACGRR